jgi:hypothetical protein
VQVSQTLKPRVPATIRAVIAEVSLIHLAKVYLPVLFTTQLLFSFPIPALQKKSAMQSLHLMGVELSPHP